MSKEITSQNSLQVKNGNHTEAQNAGSIQIDQSTIGAYSPIVTVGTSEENLVTGDIGTLGWLYLRNLDSTNYVTYGPDSSGMKAFGRIEAGETACLRLEPGITLRWIANTGSVKVKVMLLED